MLFVSALRKANYPARCQSNGPIVNMFAWLPFQFLKGTQLHEFNLVLVISGLSFLLVIPLLVVADASRMSTTDRSVLVSFLTIYLPPPQMKAQIYEVKMYLECSRCLFELKR